MRSIVKNVQYILLTPTAAPRVVSRQGFESNMPAIAKCFPSEWLRALEQEKWVDALLKAKRAIATGHRIRATT